MSDLAKAIVEQISQTSYEGGQMENLNEEVETLQECIGVLCKILVDKGVTDISTLNAELPSYGHPTILEECISEVGIIERSKLSKEESS